MSQINQVESNTQIIQRHDPAENKDKNLRTTTHQGVVALAKAVVLVVLPEHVLVLQYRHVVAPSFSAKIVIFSSNKVCSSFSGATRQNLNTEFLSQFLL